MKTRYPITKKFIDYFILLTILSMVLVPALSSDADGLGVKDLKKAAKKAEKDAKAAAKKTAQDAIDTAKKTAKDAGAAIKKGAFDTLKESPCVIIIHHKIKRCSMR